MKTWILVIGIVALLGLGGAALSQDKGQSPAAPVKEPKPVRAPESSATSKTEGEFHVIGYLEKRDKTITIKSGPRGAVYSVSTKDGKVLLENLSAEQLKAQAPELHQFIKTAVASSPDKKGVVIDASVRSEPANPSPLSPKPPSP